MQSPKIRAQLWQKLSILTLLMALAAAATTALAQSDQPTPTPQDPGTETFGRFGWWLPPVVSGSGAEIDKLFYAICWMTGIVFVGVFVAMFIFTIRYRHRPGRHAPFIHGRHRMEAVWTLVPTVILALTAAASQSTWSGVKSPAHRPIGDDVGQVEVEEDNLPQPAVRPPGVVEPTEHERDF